MDSRYYIAAHGEFVERQRSAEQARLARMAHRPSAARSLAGAMLIRMGHRLARDQRAVSATVNA